MATLEMFTTSRHMPPDERDIIYLAGAIIKSNLLPFRNLAHEHYRDSGTLLL